MIEHTCVCDLQMRLRTHCWQDNDCRSQWTNRFQFSYCEKLDENSIYRFVTHVWITMTFVRLFTIRMCVNTKQANFKNHIRTLVIIDCYYDPLATC